ncbi:MAG TPA: organomercurial lyase, partial [Actinomycetota bacterium]|nr:organomercurial lyase [Actinomycetota bacterium]
MEADDTQRLRELRQVVYREFVEEGHPPTAAEAARRLDVGVEEVLAGWGRLHDEHVLVLDEDRVGVRMAHPFSARPMHFVVASDEQKWWGGCAWDSFGIMAALGQEVLVATTCLGCGRPLALLADPKAP